MVTDLSTTQPYRWSGAICLMLAAMVLAPLLFILLGWIQIDTVIWQHLKETLLTRLLWNTVKLVAGVGIGVSILGVGLAWAVTQWEFPGRRIYEWALMLPLAMPAYVLAFVYLGLFDYTGPLQGLWRQWMGQQAQSFDARSTWMVITVLVLVLYPYVYLLCRSAFLMQKHSIYDAAQLLGLSQRQIFWRVALPIARPAVAAGTMLALMETLSDFGTVAIFNYDTFTTAIYKAWFDYFSLSTASQLASLLLLFVLMLLFTERHLRGRARFYSDPALNQPRAVLTRTQQGALLLFINLILILAFLMPVMQLILWSMDSAQSIFDRSYLSLIARTLWLGFFAVVATVSAALILAFARRDLNTPVVNHAVTVATLGYALPGSVLAVGIMFVFVTVDKVALTVINLILDTSSHTLFMGTVWALLLAYVIRFMAVAYGPLDSSLQKIRFEFAEAAQTLGASRLNILREIYIPLLRSGFFTAATLVLVDVMKEMPATLLLRPFGWDTLAVKIYEYTSEGEWKLAALPAITLVAVGMIPVYLLMQRSASPPSLPHNQSLEKEPAV